MRETMLIFHMLGLALGVGVSFTHFFLGRSRAKMEPELAKKDALRSLSLGIMTDIGLTFLIVSGLFLMKPYWSTLFDSHILMAKLAMVIVLIILLVLIRINGVKALKENGGPGLAKIKKLGKFALPIGVIIVILAVLRFK